MKQNIVFIIVLIIVNTIGVSLKQADSEAAGPPGGLQVEVTNTPLPVAGDIAATVTGGVQVTNSPDVTILNDENNPVPVTVQNAGSPTSPTEIPQNLYTVGPGGLTIGGPGEYDFGLGPPLWTQVTIFRVHTGLAMILCYTIQNAGTNTLEINDGATSWIAPGATDTSCKEFIGDRWITLETQQQGVGHFRWRVDLIKYIGD